MVTGGSDSGRRRPFSVHISRSHRMLRVNSDALGAKAAGVIAGACCACPLVHAASDSGGAALDSQPLFICRGLFLHGRGRRRGLGGRIHSLLRGRLLSAFRQPELIRSADDPRIRGPRI